MVSIVTATNTSSGFGYEPDNEQTPNEYCAMVLGNGQKSTPPPPSPPSLPKSNNNKKTFGREKRKIVNHLTSLKLARLIPAPLIQTPLIPAP